MPVTHQFRSAMQKIEALQQERQGIKDELRPLESQLQDLVRSMKEFSVSALSYV